MPTPVRIVRGIVLAAAFLGAGCALRPEPAGEDKISLAYSYGGGAWDSGGGITAVAKILPSDGRTTVCGAWMTDQQSALSSNYNEDVMQTAAIFAGGQRVVRNLFFMQRHQQSESMLGKTARCVATDLTWSRSLASAPLRLRFPTVSFGGGGGFAIGIGGIGIGVSDQVTFRETERPNPLE